jgi:predicted GNAT family acetyltransferase
VSVLVEDNPARRRFEILVDGSLAGFASYELRQDAVVFIHTEVDAARQRQGIGSHLAQAALEQVRERGERVVARCPFIATYIERNPHYADLLETA